MPNELPRSTPASYSSFPKQAEFEAQKYQRHPVEGCLFFCLHRFLPWA
jgi:hypothetical protein